MRNIIDKQLVNIKLLFFISLICSVLLSLDIFLQHLIGFDIFGNKAFDGRFNGFFEHEAIAGSYLQKFFLLSIICLFLLKKNLKQIFIIIFFTNILGLGILLSLDRMPYLIFFFSLIVLFIILKNYRIQLFISLFFIIFVFQIFFINYNVVKNRYLSLVSELELVKITNLFKRSIPKSLISSNNIDKRDDNLKGDYLKIYYAAFHVFFESPFLGTGLKSFLNECKKLQNNDNKNFTCSTHPHNIYLEILVNQGIVGLFLFLLFVVILINKNYFKVIFISKMNLKKKILSIFFFTILISELIPIRSYGSIFQTVNGSIFWFLLSIISCRMHIPKK